MAAAHVAQVAIRRHRQQENHSRHQALSSLEASVEESAGAAAVIAVTSVVVVDAENAASAQTPSSTPSPLDSTSVASVGVGVFAPPAQSSTPVRTSTRPALLRPRSADSSSIASETSLGGRSRSSSEAVFNLPLFRAPILGYEIMEQRAKFTVFKINVQHLLSHESWFVFRRYTDFLRLNKKLLDTSPIMRLSLPPKRWFKDNFDAVFLEERVLKLQTFIDGLLGCRQILDNQQVRDFFCLDDPPGPNDSLEESRLRCENLEELVSTLHVELREKEAEVEVLRAELSLSKAHRETLAKSLRVECAIVERAAPRYLPADCPNARRLHQVNVTLANMIENSINLSEHAVLEGSLRLPASGGGDLGSRVAANRQFLNGSANVQLPVSNSDMVGNVALFQNGLDTESGAHETSDSSAPLDNHSGEHLHLRKAVTRQQASGARRNLSAAVSATVLTTDDNGNKTFGATDNS